MLHLQVSLLVYKHKIVQIRRHDCKRELDFLLILTKRVFASYKFSYTFAGLHPSASKKTKMRGGAFVNLRVISHFGAFGSATDRNRQTSLGFRHLRSARAARPQPAWCNAAGPRSPDPLVSHPHAGLLPPAFLVTMERRETLLETKTPLPDGQAGANKRCSSE